MAGPEVSEPRLSSLTFSSLAQMNTIIQPGNCKHRRRVWINSSVIKPAFGILASSVLRVCPYGGRDRDQSRITGSRSQGMADETRSHRSNLSLKQVLPMPTQSGGLIEEWFFDVEVFGHRISFPRTPQCVQWSLRRASPLRPPISRRHRANSTRPPSRRAL